MDVCRLDEQDEEEDEENEEDEKVEKDEEDEKEDENEDDGEDNLSHRVMDCFVGPVASRVCYTEINSTYPYPECQRHIGGWHRKHMLDNPPNKSDNIIHFVLFSSFVQIPPCGHMDNNDAIVYL